MREETDLDKLKKKLKKVQAENKSLVQENSELKDRIEKQKRKFALSEIRLQYFENQYALAAADLIVSPDPIKVHGSSGGRGLDFFVELMNVIVVRSKGRLEEIFLKTQIQPAEGGKLCSFIHLNSEVSDFSNALRSLQGRSTHLLRVNKSLAVNIHYYELVGEKTLFINLTTIPKSLEQFKSIKTDKLFDFETYQERKTEIQDLSRYKK